MTNEWAWNGGIQMTHADGREEIIVQPFNERKKPAEPAEQPTEKVTLDQRMGLMLESLCSGALRECSPMDRHCRMAFAMALIEMVEQDMDVEGVFRLRGEELRATDYAKEARAALRTAFDLAGDARDLPPDSARDEAARDAMIAAAESVSSLWLLLHSIRISSNEEQPATLS